MTSSSQVSFPSISSCYSPVFRSFYTQYPGSSVLTKPHAKRIHLLDFDWQNKGDFSLIKHQCNLTGKHHMSDHQQIQWRICVVNIDSVVWSGCRLVGFC